MILIWDLSKKYFYQKEILLVSEVEEDEGISHITAKEGDQSYVFHDTTFRAKAMNLTPEENLLIFQEQIDSIEQKRGIISDDEKELLEYLHADLEREKQQYEREQQEKQQEQQKEEISNESQDEKQENTKEEKQEKLQEESQEKEEKSDSSEVVQKDEEISSISSSEETSPSKETKTTSKDSQTKPQKKSEPSQETKQETTVSTPSTTTSTTTKPTGKEKLYKVCGTFSFGKMYSYYLCEIDDVDKQKEVFSKKL